MDEPYQDLVAIARRYGAGESSGRRNAVAHSMGCSLALRLAAEAPTASTCRAYAARRNRRDPGGGSVSDLPAAACLLDRSAALGGLRGARGDARGGHPGPRAHRARQGATAPPRRRTLTRARVPPSRRPALSDLRSRAPPAAQASSNANPMYV